MKPRIYSSRFLRLRRKVKNVWDLIWGYDGPHVQYWSNLDQQERHPGDLSFAQVEQAKSPLHWYCMGQQFVHGFATPWYRVPFSVWIAEIKYKMLCWMPHPEWSHAPRQGTRSHLIKSIAGSMLKWIRDLFLPNVPGILGALVDRVGTAAGRFIAGYRIATRYPRKVTVRLKKRDYAAAKERIAEMESRYSQALPNDLHHRMLQMEMVINAVVRYMWINRPWLECLWQHSLESGTSQYAVIIRVARTGRVHARYQLPQFALVGWIPGTPWPKKAIILENVPESDSDGKSRANAVKMTLEQSAAHNFTQYEMPELVDTEAVARDGRKVTLDLGINRFITHPSHALRIMATELRIQSQPKETVRIQSGLDFDNLFIIPSDRIEVPSVIVGSGSEKVDVRSTTIHPDWTITMLLRGSPDDLYADTIAPFELQRQANTGTEEIT